MAINIKSPDVERLVRELAELTGESITDAIQHAVRERLTRERLRKLGAVERSWARVQRIQERIAGGAAHSGMRADEVLGYDANGVPR
ncbi:MAG TPA: type II toxin-antitoxin system VapB family antitoxin [Gemmatimonas sp.]|uniref:type II toxin-antitoxin system VapB family antitoxin n=1 Tax=Gemmatimonas sp. TaxID=1962908 RepID=UPI002ED903AD